MRNVALLEQKYYLPRFLYVDRRVGSIATVSTLDNNILMLCLTSAALGVVSLRVGPTDPIAPGIA